jgi:hypothetical protein
MALTKEKEPQSKELDYGTVPVSDPYDRMNEQQREEGRALFEGLFGPQQQQEPPRVTYDPNSTDKQNFMAALLFAEGEEREKSEQHQARGVSSYRLEDEHTGLKKFALQRPGRSLEMARVHLEAISLCYEIVELAENLGRRIENSMKVEAYPR